MKICIWGYFNRPFWGYLIFKAGIYRPTTYMSIEIEWYENIKMYERPFNAIIDVLIAGNCKLWFWITSAIACKLGHIILKMMICHLIIIIVKCPGVSPSSPFCLLFFKVSSSEISIGTIGTEGIIEIYNHSTSSKEPQIFHCGLAFGAKRNQF